jgi:hypothetical protein
VIDDVEFALAAGVTRSSVLEELAAHGLEMTLATFDTTLKRIRQKRNKTSITSLKLRKPRPVAVEHYGCAYEFFKCYNLILS